MEMDKYHSKLTRLLKRIKMTWQYKDASLLSYRLNYLASFIIQAPRAYFINFFMAKINYVTKKAGVFVKAGPK